MKLYQIQSRAGMVYETISAVTPSAAVLKLRETHGHIGQSWDYLYAWEFDGDFRVTLLPPSAPQNKPFC